MGKKIIKIAEINDQVQINDIAFLVFAIGQLNSPKTELQGEINSLPECTRASNLSNSGLNCRKTD
jgi:hypothetical protein